MAHMGDIEGLAGRVDATMGGKTPIVDEDALRDASRPNWFETYHEDLVSGRAAPGPAPVPGGLRRLTIREAALIQTFPPGYDFRGLRTKRYRQIGNAVPCLFAEAVAESLKACYLERPASRL